MRIRIVHTAKIASAVPTISSTAVCSCDGIVSATLVWRPPASRVPQQRAGPDVRRATRCRSDCHVAQERQPPQPGRQQDHQHNGMPPRHRGSSWRENRDVPLVQSRCRRRLGSRQEPPRWVLPPPYVAHRSRPPACRFWGMDLRIHVIDELSATDFAFSRTLRRSTSSTVPPTSRARSTRNIAVP
jgi:hypothetical protein